MLKTLLWGRYSPALPIIELLLILPLTALALVARYSRKRIDVGLGPQPLINNCYHKQALQCHGYSAETFVGSVYYITDRFDLNLGRKRLDLLPPVWKPVYLFARAIFRYKALFIYFNGGPLIHTRWLYRLEPFFYKLARVKVVVMPYGSDVQNMALCPNLYFKHAMSVDYPDYHRKYASRTENVARWTRHADWILSGCDWVDYMWHWHTLQLAHFSIDMSQWQPGHAPRTDGPLRILHAPNHPTIKGTDALVRAVEELQAEGLNIELTILRGVPNSQVQQVMSEADLIADQFVVGWYAMFAIEAMALEKPVLCYVRPDLHAFFIQAGLLGPDELPLIDTPLTDIKDRLRWACRNRDTLVALGRRGRQYVARHHSVEAVGATFAHIMRQLGIPPGQGDNVVALPEATPLQEAVTSDCAP